MRGFSHPPKSHNLYKPRAPLTQGVLRVSMGETSLDHLKRIISLCVSDQFYLESNIVIFNRGDEYSKNDVKIARERKKERKNGFGLFIQLSLHYIFLNYNAPPSTFNIEGNVLIFNYCASMCSTPWPKGGVVVDYMHWQPEQVSLGGPPAAPETVFCFQHPPLASFHETLNVKGGFSASWNPKLFSLPPAQREWSRQLGEDSRDRTRGGQLPT